MKQVSIVSLVLLCALVLIAPLTLAQESVDQAMSEAKRQYSSGNYQAAISALNQVTDEAPDRADAFYLIGYSHLMLRQYAESVDAFARAFQLDPTLDPRSIYQARPTE